MCLFSTVTSAHLRSDGAEERSPGEGVVGSGVVSSLASEARRHGE